MMIPTPILAEIMTYLTLSELAITSQVSRKFYFVCNSQALYKREFLRLSIGFLCSNECTTTDWKSLCLAGIQAKAGWRDIPDFIFTETELKLLYTELVCALKEPQFVMPAFRRDIFNMPTLAQDFLANPEEQFCANEELEFYSDGIRSYLQENLNEIYSCTPLAKVVQMRWNVKSDKERLSIGSEMTDASENGSNFLVQFFKCITKVIKNYCKGVAAFVCEAEKPLEAYADCWEKYSNASRKINSLFLPVTEVVNEFYEANYEPESCPRVNFFKVMNGIWAKNVFEVCKDVIVSKVVQEIQELKKSGDPFFAQSRRIVEALLDLSLTELNVFFKHHSMLALEGPYCYLHNAIVKSSGQGFCEEILTAIVIPVTVKECRKEHLRVLAESQGDMMIDEEFEKSESDLMIEYSAQNYGIEFENSDDCFSMWKERSLFEVMNFLESYKILYS